MKTVVHVTHEAVEKMGGIGAVLDGLLTSTAYHEAVDRTVLLCPLFTTEGTADTRLGRNGEVLYSTIDGLIRSEFTPAFRKIEQDFNVGIVYGRRHFVNHDTGLRTAPEVILIDITRIDLRRVNQFKGQLWQRFGIDSIRYENSWEYEQYVKLALPGLAAVEAIGGVPRDGHCIVVAHEFMGMPTALAAILSSRPGYRTIFYAHEVATMRKLVEDHPGHDTMFYNVLRAAHTHEQFLDDVFGAQDHYFKHALVSASQHCDKILAVGDYVVKELKFMGPAFEHADISLCYNGIPASSCDLRAKLTSKAKIQRYCQILLDYRPDYVFSHVSRLAVSKGLWRDLEVLGYLEKAFRSQDKTAIMILLSTEMPRRRREDILHMEKWWRWPVAHREGPPDLSGGEAVLYTGVQEFNARARNIKVLLINQFGFSSESCGTRMPADIEFMDIRRGTDLEFGQSVYEPFGIAMLEPLTFGGICLVSKVCGCVGFVQAVSGETPPPNVIIADYTDLDEPILNVKDLLQIGRTERDGIEQRVARKAAEQILRILPQTNQQTEALIASGYEAAAKMGWEIVARDYFLPAVEQACSKHRVLQVV